MIDISDFSTLWICDCGQRGVRPTTAAAIVEYARHLKKVHKAHDAARRAMATKRRSRQERPQNMQVKQDIPKIAD